MPLVHPVFALDSPGGVGHFVGMTLRSAETVYDVLVVGAGLAGLAGALALAHAGASVCLCDAAKRPPAKPSGADMDPRVTALSPSSVLMLEVLGLRNLRNSPVAGMKVSAVHPDAGLMPGLLSFGDDTENAQALAFIQPNGALLRALRAAVSAHPGIDQAFETSVERIITHAAHVDLFCTDGEKLQAKVLVGADGRQSTIRKRAGIDAFEYDYGTTAIVTTLTHSAPHEHTARQFFRPAGPLACLPLGKTRNRWTTSLVWPEKNNLAQALLGLGLNDLRIELADRLDGLLGDVTKLAPPVSYPLGLLLAQNYVGPRLALLGEAAHIIHPLAGQGYNLTLRDAAQLADCYHDARRLGLDVGAPATLAEYDRLRRRDATLMASATHMFATTFSARPHSWAPWRKALFSAANRVPLLRTMAGRTADLGHGPVPRLLRGEGFTG